MSQDEPHVTGESGGVSAPRDRSGNTASRPTSGDGTAATSFFGRHPIFRRHRWFMAWSAASFLTLGVFVATHGTPGAQAPAEMDCSSYAVAQIVGDIVHKHVFAGQAGAFVDESRFGGQLLDVVTEKRKPLTCAANFKPNVFIAKGFLAQVGNGKSAAEIKGIEKEVSDKLTGRLTYTVKRTDDDRLYVEITDGLETFDD